MSASTRAGQRAAVRGLAAQEVSNRTIAKQVGVSESTVRRWRASDAPHRVTDSVREPDATPVPVTADDATDDALTVPLDDDLRDRLKVLAEAGYAPEAIIQLALGLVADAYAYAWDYGLTERGTAPDIQVMVRAAR